MQHYYTQLEDTQTYDTQQDDTRYYDIQYNDTQHYDNQHYDIIYKSCIFYRKILLKVLTKFGTKFGHFGWTKWSQGEFFAQKGLFSTHDPNWVYILQKFADSLAELDNILHNLARKYSSITHSKVISRMPQK